MDKDKMDLALSIARSYYQYHVPVREIMAKCQLAVLQFTEFLVTLQPIIHKS